MEIKEFLYENFRNVLEIALQNNKFDCGCVFSIDENNEKIQCVVKHWCNKDHNKNFTRWLRNHLNNNEPVYYNFPDINQGNEVCKGVRSMAVIPAGNMGKTYAILVLASHTFEAISKETVVWLNSLCSMSGLIFENIDMKNELTSLKVNMEELVFITDMNGYILYVNPKLNVLLDHPVVTEKKMNITDLYRVGNHDRFSYIIQELKKSNSFVCNVPLTTRTGNCLPIVKRCYMGNWANKKILFIVSADFMNYVTADHVLNNGRNGNGYSNGTTNGYSNGQGNGIQAKKPNGLPVNGYANGAVNATGPGEKPVNGESINKVALPVSTGFALKKIEEIIYCKSINNLTEIYFKSSERLVISKNLGEFEEIFNHHNFFRIHKSCIVNLECIKEYNKTDGNVIIMANNDKLDLAVRRKEAFIEALVGLGFIFVRTS